MPDHNKRSFGSEELLIALEGQPVHYHELDPDRQGQALEHVRRSVVTHPNDDAADWVEVAILLDVERRAHLYLFKDKLTSVLTHATAPFEGALESVVKGKPTDWLQARENGEPIRLAQ